MLGKACRSRVRVNVNRRPGKFIRERAYPADAERKTTPTVIPSAKMSVLRVTCQMRGSLRKGQF